jgi:hypothetical protein
MRYVGALGLIFAIILGLAAITQLDGLQTSLLGSVPTGLASLVNSMSFILMLFVAVLMAGGVMAAFSILRR